MNGSTLCSGNLMSTAVTDRICLIASAILQLKECTTYDDLNGLQNVVFGEITLLTAMAAFPYDI